ncbi:MAG: FAD:protein FMN transferase [Crocinitomicaceae bacterium]|nr:FAD:protein FMN transferase [Crocinitomicaceae bacterium]
MRNYSVIISLFFLFSCTSKNSEKVFHTLSGFTQGTTYTITVVDDSLHFKQSEIDHLLAEFDTILSTYIDESKITQLNNSTTYFAFEDNYHFFKNCYNHSLAIYNETNELFDPSIYPLVKQWGFYKKSNTVPAQAKIDSIIHFIGFKPELFHTVQFQNDSVYFQKKDERFKLDFNAIAQGYSVDVLAEFIENRGHKNYYIEIGGELRVKGKNSSEKDWTIGIDSPGNSSNHSTLTTLSVTNCGIATSGNYRNFFEIAGKKYGHILNPKTGYPVNSDIISVTVVAPNATLADAYATYFMIIGKEKTIQFVEKHNNIQVVLMYLDKMNQTVVYQSGKGEGGRLKGEGRRMKEEGGRLKEEGGRRKDEG